MLHPLASVKATLGGASADPTPSLLEKGSPSSGVASVPRFVIDRGRCRDGTAWSGAEAEGRGPGERVWRLVLIVEVNNQPLSRPTSIPAYAQASTRRSRSDLLGRSSGRRASGGDRAGRAVHRSVRSATLAGVAGRDELPRPSTRSSRTVTTEEPDSAGRESRTTRGGPPASNRGGPHRAPCRGRMLGDGGWNMSGGDELDG